MKNRILSGIQPTGIPTLGNYLGAIQNWVALQDTHECLFCVVDLHAITNWQEPARLRAQTLEMAAAVLACGIDPARSVLFVQSAVSAHAPPCLDIQLRRQAGMAEPHDPVQGPRRRRPRSCLGRPLRLSEPDGRGHPRYHATRVPVGDDQRQHLELANDIAEKFNHDYGVDFFPRIEPLILVLPPGS